MRYTKSIIYLYGKGWCNQPIATQIYLRPYDLENIKERGNGTITREAIDEWLCSNSGDFSVVEDFSASISYEDVDVEIDWEDEEKGMAYSDIAYPCYD